MEYLIGAGLAVLVCVFATMVGFDRDRVFYPTIATVISTYYVLFAVIGSSTSAAALESLIAGAFLLLAVMGFKKNLWAIVAALVGHGVFDFFHHLFIQNPVSRCGGLASAFRSTFSPAHSLPCYCCGVPGLLPFARAGP